MIFNYSLGKKSWNKSYILSGFTYGGRRIFEQKSGKFMGKNHDPIAVTRGRSGRIMAGLVESETTPIKVTV